MAKDALDKIESRWSLGGLLWALLPPAFTGTVGSVVIALTDALNAYAPASYFFGFAAGVLIWLTGLAAYGHWKLKSATRARFRDLQTPRSAINPLDVTFERKRIWISDLTVPGIMVVEGKKFIGCQLIGPGIIMFDGSTLNGNGFRGCDSLVISNPDADIHNVIVLKNCTIIECDLISLTLYWPEQHASTFEKGVTNAKVVWLTHPPKAGL